MVCRFMFLGWGKLLRFVKYVETRVGIPCPLHAMAINRWMPVLCSCAEFRVWSVESLRLYRVARTIK